MKRKIVFTALLVCMSLYVPFYLSAQSYFTGNGGKGKSLGVLLPEGQGLPADLSYIPAMVQGSLVTNIKKYSAMSVLDRVALDKTIAETLDPTYKDDLSIVRLGHVAQVGYMMTGQIRRTSTGYNMQINVTDTNDGKAIASYSGVCTIAELDNLTAIQLASKELLTQMGVSLTQNAVNELSAQRTQNAISAETALARGVTAQKQGTEVAALSYYFQAAALDPSLQEATSRSSVISANITSDNIGANVRNDIEWRKQWIARLTEFEEVFSKLMLDVNNSDPPYTLFYSTGIEQGTINYQTETANLSIPINLRANGVWLRSIAQSANKVYTELNTGLNATKKRTDWGLANWPGQSLTKTNAFSSQKQYDFSIVFELVNEQNKVIGRQTIKLTPSYSFTRNRDNQIGVTFAENTFNTVTFNAVNANDISDNLTIRIASVNGTSPQNARFQITAVSDQVWQEYRKNGRFIVRNGVVLGFDGIPYGYLVIPDTVNIWGETSVITSIGAEAFLSKKIVRVYIPKSVTSIGNKAFGNNPDLTSVTFEGKIAIENFGDNAFPEGRSQVSGGYVAIDGNKLRSRYRRSNSTETYTRINKDSAEWVKEMK